MAGATDLLVVLVLLAIVALTPPTAVVTMLILLARRRHWAPTNQVVRSDPDARHAAPTDAPTVVIDNFLQYPYGPWSYFHAGGLLMRAPRDGEGHLLVAQAHPAHLEWCDDVTPVEILHILQALEEATATATGARRAP